MNSYTPHQRQHAVDRYLDGEPSPQIAADLGCDPTSVLNWVRNAGHPARPGGRNHYTATQRDHAVRRYLDGQPTAQIAADLGCAPKSVLNWVRDAGHPVRPSVHKRYDDSTKQQAVDMYTDGHTIQQIADHTGAAFDTVSTWLHNRGINPGPPGSTIPDAVRTATLDLYQQGVATSILADIVNVDDKTILKWVRAADIDQHHNRATDIDRATAPERLHNIINDIIVFLVDAHTIDTPPDS